MNTMTATEDKYAVFKEIEKFEYGTLFQDTNHPSTYILRADSDYIPIEEFKKMFNALAAKAGENGVNKLIFDKRNLKVFHQPSMEWYFTNWKEEVFGRGLRIHRKILPQDQLFRNSVQIGRNKINKEYPKAKFHEMDIQYAESLQEALSK